MANAAPFAYRVAGFFMLRSPVLPADTLAGLEATLTASENAASTAPGRWPGVALSATPEAVPGAAGGSLEEQRRRGRRWLDGVAADARVRDAIHLASPSLAATMARPNDRAYSSLLRYVLRMATRPTPHGLFAAVAIGTFGGPTTLGLESDSVRRTRTRADAAWLQAIIKRVEDDERIRDGLPITSNALAALRAGRLNLFRPAERVSVRATPPALLTLELAARGMTYGDIVDEIQSRFPNANPSLVRSLLTQLWQRELLIGACTSPSTISLPEQHLIKQLSSVHGAEDVVAGLRRMRALADAVDSGRGHRDPVAIEELTRHQRTMTPEFTGPTCQLDAALATTGTRLSSDIATTAEEAAELLARLSFRRPAQDHLAAYHRLFLERYGLSSEIPLLEVLSHETGLGPPDTYTQPSRAHPLPPIPDVPHEARDRALVALVSEAIHFGRREVELTDEHLAALTVATPPASPSLDLYFQIVAGSPADIDGGRWRIVLSPGTFHGLRTFGRFFDLYDEAAPTLIRDFARAEEALYPQSVWAELNYRVPGRAANVAAHPSIRTHEVCVNAAATLPPDRQISLDDVMVGASAQHFYLRSVRLGKRLVVTQSHALVLTQAPNACRALVELSMHEFAQPPYFDWGPVRNAPYLPRLARGRVVLTPAQWTLALSPQRLGGDPDRFRDAVLQWRREWGVPRHVYLTVNDRRLFLDLDHPLCTDELHRDLRQAEKAGLPARLTLQEVLPGDDQLWLRDSVERPYHAEIVVPLLSRTPQNAPHTPNPPPPTTAVPRRWTAGQEWTQLNLYCAESEQDNVITKPLADLVTRLGTELGLVDRWFYVRYADPLPHLRLRFHATRTQEIMEITTWARGLVETGVAHDLSLVTYHRELERYGGPQAIADVEEIFHISSQLSTAMLQFLCNDKDFEQELACVLALQLLADCWDVQPEAAQGISDFARQRFRAVKPLLCELLEPGETRPDPRAAEYGPALRVILDEHRGELAAAAQRIRRLGRRGLLTAPEHSILGSLQHMQVNRILGIDAEREDLCHELWWLASRAIRGRRRAR